MMAARLAMITIEEVANHAGLLVTCSGDVHASDLCAQTISLKRRFPDTIRGWYFSVADLSKVDNLTVSPADFDQLVEEQRKVSEFTRKGLAVAVIAKSELVFGISRMWQVASEVTGWECQVFRDRVPAESWLRRLVLVKFAVELPELRSADPGLMSRGEAMGS